MARIETERRNGADPGEGLSGSAPCIMKAIPDGISSFEGMIRGEDGGNPYYYVDKTLLIREVASTGGKVNLIPRPRRFGKSLNLDMIRLFMSQDADGTLFDGLRISEDKYTCAKYQNQYPVLYLDMKDIRAESFQLACEQLSQQIVITFKTFKVLETSPKLDDTDRATYRMYTDSRQWRDNEGKRTKSLAVSELEASLQWLSIFLHEHYGKKVVVLIDEYDVPLHSAWAEREKYPDYYDKMVSLIRNMFSRLLKNNLSVEFAVVTGCLRIAQESIITGINNLTVWGYDRQFSRDYFGFTEAEVKTMLAYYGIPELFATVKTWYDGFHFGGESLYCPWDVLKYVRSCVSGMSNREPQLFWANSSGNDILTDLLNRSCAEIQRDYISLMNGKTVEAWIMYEMTFRDLEDADSIWSFMVATGYLKIVSETGSSTKLAATNLEVRTLLAEHLITWICNLDDRNEEAIRLFCEAFPKGDVKGVISQLTKILTSMIHRQDQRQSEGRRESLYQGIVLGLLYLEYNVLSNLESGDGYCDVCFGTDDKIGVAIEMKDPGQGDLTAVADSALKQIKDKNYIQELVNRGCGKILMYGIACRFHEVSVVLEEWKSPDHPDAP